MQRGLTFKKKKKTGYKETIDMIYTNVDVPKQSYYFINYTDLVAVGFKTKGRILDKSSMIHAIHHMHVGTPHI